MASGKVSGGRLFLVGLVGAFVEVGLGQIGFLLLWAAVSLVLAIVFAILSRKATEANIFTYLFIFFISSSLSIFGIIAAYSILRMRHLTD
jgi:hypothetical protein